MSTLWTSQDAARATGGKAIGNWEVSGVSIDTRTLERGDLFVALKAVRDGHDFVADALSKGAGAALVSYVPEGVLDGAPLLVVDDVQKGLEDLGIAARERMGGKVIAVTGSAGKTSTKEMLRIALQGQGPVHAAEKSYNNHWGVPLTLARMPADTSYAIIEIGMNHPGEIAPLAKQAQPHVAIVTTVAAAHLEAFSSVDEIAAEKASIFEGLVEGGRAIINADLPTRAILEAAAPASVLSFGTSDDADWRLHEATVTENRTVARAEFNDETVLFKLGAPGKHFAMNAVAALAAMRAAGADLGRTAIALSNWAPPQGRGQRTFVTLDSQHPEHGIDLIDDAYNANPASVAAALEVLANAKPSSLSGRRVAILGDMKELGDGGPALHADLANSEAMESIHKVHCVGPLMRHLYEALSPGQRGLWAKTALELAAQPLQLVREGDVVMAKGSLSIGMASVVDAIRNLGQQVVDDTEGHH